jgi:YVTN family beta-propeller protein
MRTGIVLSAIATLALIVSCGDESTGPSGSELTPSTLSLSFTGDSSKIGVNNDLSFPRQEALSIISSRENRTDSKGNCEVTVSWTECTGGTFQSYTLYRSEISGIFSNPTSAEVLGKFTDASNTEYTDSDIDWSTKYYYALKTTDENDNCVWSNEDSITTPGTAPLPSVLSTGDITWSSAELYWSQCTDYDFFSYRLYRSEIPNIQDDTIYAKCVCSISEAVDTTYTDNEVTIFHYYALMTTNTKGLSSWSNEIEVSIPQNYMPSEVVATVDVGGSPRDICSLPSGEYVYVVKSGDDISVIRTSDNSVVATVDVGDYPISICSLPSGEYVYVTHSYSGSVSVIRTSDNSVVDTIDIGVFPSGICSLPSGEYVYVINDDSTFVIRTSDNTVVETMDVDGRAICSLPSGEYVYVISHDGTVVIRTSDNVVVATVDAFGNDICALPSGEYVYVCEREVGDVHVIRTLDNTVVETFEVGAEPGDICSLPSGEYLYIIEGTYPFISIVRTTDNSVVDHVNLESYGFNICSLPCGEYVYVTHAITGTVSVIH